MRCLKQPSFPRIHIRSLDLHQGVFWWGVFLGSSKCEGVREADQAEGSAYLLTSDHGHLSPMGIALQSPNEARDPAFDRRMHPPWDGGRP